MAPHWPFIQSVVRTFNYISLVKTKQIPSLVPVKMVSSLFSSKYQFKQVSEDSMSCNSTRIRAACVWSYRKQKQKVED
jgi:hypothetical protein